VRFAGARIGSLPTEDIVRLGIAHVPDGRGTFTRLTTEENLRLGAFARRKAAFTFTRSDKAALEEDYERVYRLFPILRDRRAQQAGTLSGGQQQMLAVARALMLRPRLLLLDEPSFGLAPLVVREIFAVMAQINREQKVTILLVEQNAAMALNLADHAHLLETGRIVLSGTAEHIRSNDAVRRSYLGQ
jgi:branched-chain amino acid transport system ATP-binding protein